MTTAASTREAPQMKVTPYELICGHALECARSRAREIEFRFSVQADLGCPVARAKIFVFRFFENCASLPSFRTDTRGVSRSSRTWCGMRWTRRCWRRAASTRTAKSCGPGAPMQALSPREAESFAKATVAIAGSPRRARISRKPLRGEGRSVSACTCGSRARANFFCAGAPGAAATRPSLHPLLSRAVSFSKTRAKRAAGTQMHVSHRHCPQSYNNPASSRPSEARAGTHSHRPVPLRRLSLPVEADGQIPRYGPRPPCPIAH
jgi:hypothetical protein